MGIGRGLSRLAQDRLELGDPRGQALDHLCLLQQKGVLLSVTQAIPGWQRHPYLDSYPEADRPPRCHPGEQLRIERSSDLCS